MRAASKLLVALALLASSPAVAEPAHPELDAQYERCRNANAAFARAGSLDNMAQLAVMCRASLDDALRKDVGALVAAGDCVEAEQLALSEGRLDIAGQVRQFCAIKPKPAQ